MKIFEIDGINYSKAWELLERSYEVKRILISQHLSSLLNLLNDVRKRDYKRLI